MKLVQINTVCNTSTGHIMGNIQRAANGAGYETFTIFGRRKGYRDLRCERVGNGLFFWLHVALTTALDLHGLGSILITRRMVQILRRERPDIIHLHNIHGYYLNYPILFKYLKEEYTGKIFWTLHDCWPYTGHCAYYTAAGCDKWKTMCHHCPEKKEYPVSLFRDGSSGNYKRKKSCFTELKDMTIIVPSEWLKGQVEESFLGCYPVEVVNNGINLNVFRPSSDRWISNSQATIIQNSDNQADSQQNSTMQTYGLQNSNKQMTSLDQQSIYPTIDIRSKYVVPKEKKILLGVAMYWTKRKGLEDFIRLSAQINDDYVIVLVGVSPSQKAKLPGNVIGISRTENVRALVQLYSEAHIFINPSVEETFSMVTVEAMACGTPVIALDTSAVQELITEDTGVVLHKEFGQDIPVEEYLSAIHLVEKRMKYRLITTDTLVNHASEYSVERQIDNILALYKGDNV